MDTPIVTVVTVTYNALEALQKTAKSVESQTFRHFEYIVVDGGSSDGTPLWLKTHRSPSLTWVSEPDKGIYDAMNKGVRMAHGEWVLFMNAGDCFVSEDVLERVFRALPATDVIYGDVVKDGVVKKALSPRNAHRMFFCHQSCFVRKNCLLDYPFDTRHKMSADFKLIKQLWYAHKSFLQLNFPIADFDTKGISNTRRSDGIMDNIQVIREVDKMTEQIKFIPRLLFTYIICRIRGK